MYFSEEEKSKTRLSSPPAPLDTNHTPSLITLQKLNRLSFTAPVAVTLFQFSPPFYLPPILTWSSFVLLTSPTQTSSSSNMNIARGGRQRASLRNQMISSWCGPASLHCPLVFGIPLCTCRGLVSQRAETSATDLEASHPTGDLHVQWDPFLPPHTLWPVSVEDWELIRAPLGEGGCCARCEPRRWSAGCSHRDRAR